MSRQQQLEVPLVPLENCERIFGESVPVNEGQLCAGGEEGKDACSGFGGAPLLLFRQGRHVQVRIGHCLLLIKLKSYNELHHIIYLWKHGLPCVVLYCLLYYVLASPANFVNIFSHF